MLHEGLSAWRKKFCAVIPYRQSPLYLSDNKKISNTPFMVAVAGVYREMYCGENIIPAQIVWLSKTPLVPIYC
ncbi:unnamed protein product [Allacma fusca]|uniref:Uncharacterized protein n=1 Tax=Allacma fusca TaxID=39272 RepID=A0A8J2KSQ2_9HEXA|nr:unnamed protein product [Allacma fusca]